MTKIELEQIEKLKGEIKTLQSQISDVQSHIVSDTVTGCTPSRPDKHVIRITGIDTTKSDKLHRKMRIKLEELQELLYDLETWIEELPDPEVRNIMRLYYRNGLTQEEIGRELGYSRQRIGQKLNEFLESVK